MIISVSVFLRMRNFSDESCRDITHALCSIAFFENRAVFETKWKKMYSRTGQRWQYGACAFHAGYLRLQIYNQNM